MKHLYHEILVSICLLFGTIGQEAALFAQGSPAVLIGVVTNAVSGAPVIGARISVGNQFAYSTSGGIYSMNIDPPGTFPVHCTKPGFDGYTAASVAFQQGVTTTLNIALSELANPPASVVAQLDTLLQEVMVDWDIPSGDYEVLYDDGIQDNFTIWAAPGNQNAVRFTPAGYPAAMTGGSIHIGTAANYPSGSNPLVPFQVKILDATGPGGTPGNILAGPFDVTPQSFGWVTFSLPTPVSIASGSFFLVMIQAGTPPNAAGLAIDETTSQMRSYFRFTTGGAPWVPASGNFMMRVTMEGPGGPMNLTENGESITGYQVWRLRQGEEQNPVIWTSVGFTTAPALSDNAWPSLACGPYRWGIRAQYTGNRWSAVSFSNILGKCWTAPVTVNINMSCESAGPEDTRIILRNLVYPDTVYSGLPDTSGMLTLSAVWKGTYGLECSRFGYQNSTQTLPVMGPTAATAFLLQIKSPASNLQVNDKSLVATWNAPHFQDTLFSEDWTSGTFSTQGWTTEGGFNWIISNAAGNPAPSAMFNWSPQATGYSQTLTSSPVSGQRSSLLKLHYDIFLDNFGTTTLNSMAVEIWDGIAWTVLKNYNSSGGSIPWTSEIADLDDYTDLDFRFRFRAYGGDTYDINGWNLDNIRIIASESDQLLATCILGYNFYLDNVVSGFTPEVKYTIPGDQVVYGTTYVACVAAAYGSGFSEKICAPFISRFLWPVRNLTGAAIENVAFLAWEKPEMPYDTGFITPEGLIGYSIYRNDMLIDTIPGENTLEYYDEGLEPGSYDYQVRARYDLTSYGFPGQTDESHAAGPVTLQFSYGRSLPFFEPWDHASFSFNDWRFTPEQGNWKISTDEGTPIPAAMLTWEPPVQSYEFALESPALDGSPFHCASIWLDFDVKLEDRNETGDERLYLELFYNGSWHTKDEFSNTGSFDWQPRQYEINPVSGKGFRIRFRAKGVKSDDIIGWYIDNIHIYAVCHPVRDLTGEAAGYDVRLAWSPPDCNGGAALLNEGFEGQVFPPENWTGIMTNMDATWSHTGTGSTVGVHSGNYSAGVIWDYNHQDEWLIANDVYVGGNLKFWSYAFQGSSHGDHYYVKISNNQGGTWNILTDLSAMPPYPSTNGYNEWSTPYEIDLSFYQGETVDIGWHATDGNGQGLWYSWAIDDCTIGSDKVALMPSGGASDGKRGQLLGYNIFRRESGASDFVQINGNLIQDTSYTDPGLNAGQYEYFALPVFVECDRATTSDTIVVDVITSVQSREQSSMILVHPNPANEYFRLTSTAPILEFRLINSLGKAVFTSNGSHDQTVTIDVRSLDPGIYVLKATTKEGLRAVKVMLSR